MCYYDDDYSCYSNKKLTERIKELEYRLANTASMGAADRYQIELSGLYEEQQRRDRCAKTKNETI